MTRIQRIHVIYTGTVQGVGFRFAVEKVASRLRVTGFVKNLTDGNVEVICEAPKEELNALLEGIQGYMQGFISGSHVDWASASGEFSSFEIRS